MGITPLGSSVGLARNGFAVTPADADLDVPASALYIGVTGDLRITTSEGDDLTFLNVAVGWFPVMCKRVWSTNTTASEIIGVY